MLPWSEMKNILAELDISCRNFDYERVRKILLNAPTAFNPTDDICDLLWKENNS